MSERLREVINGLETNIKLLEEAEELHMVDVKELLIELFGIIRDMWENFDKIFNKVDKLEDIETKMNGEASDVDGESNPDNKDIQSLYL